MTSPISGSSTPPVTIPATAGAPPPTTTETKSKTEMDKDLFLKLLVAQLKYQDPTKPADTTQFLAQTAQFTMVEKLEALSKQQSEMVTAQLMSAATNLIGRTVTYTERQRQRGRPVSSRPPLSAAVRPSRSVTRMLRCPRSRKSDPPSRTRRFLTPPIPRIRKATSTMLRSLFSGISGLRSHQQMMDVTEQQHRQRQHHGLQVVAAICSRTR